MTVLTQLAGIAAGTAMSVVIAGCATTGLAPVEQAQAAPTAAQQSDTPPCGYDAHKRSVDVISLGKAHGTVRVIEWTKPVRYDGRPRGIGTDVGRAKIKAGQAIRVKTTKRVKPDNVTVDIVKGKLTANDTPNGWKRVSKCEPA